MTYTRSHQPRPRRVVIAGGTGTLGQALAANLAEAGHTVHILTRRVRHELPYQQHLWDGYTVDASWAALLQGSILINLAGELVDRIPTRRNIALLADSRVNPTYALVDASHRYGAPDLWLQMSTLAIYGDGGEALLTETSPRADGPAQMAGVANQWESAAYGAKTDRLVFLRTAVVLEQNTPALNRLVTMTKLFLGGQVSHGRQYVSWIHAHDFIRAVRFIISTPDIDGPVLLTAPTPVRNRRLMKELRLRLNRPWTPPTPALLVKVGALLLFRTDPALALTGRKAYPDTLTRHGFQFVYPTIGAALDNLIPQEHPEEPGL